jgi:hypothetical protein
MRTPYTSLALILGASSEELVMIEERREDAATPKNVGKYEDPMRVCSSPNKVC